MILHFKTFIFLCWPGDYREVVLFCWKTHNSIKYYFNSILLDICLWNGCGIYGCIPTVRELHGSMLLLKGMFTFDKRQLGLGFVSALGNMRKIIWFQSLFSSTKSSCVKIFLLYRTLPKYPSGEKLYLVICKGPDDHCCAEEFCKALICSWLMSSNTIITTTSPYLILKSTLNYF